jgi:PIN domain nuclease of toxin-antitoxin system
MRLLLDTHALLWWMWGDTRLSMRARREIDAADAEIFVSAASAFEISIKVRMGKLPEAERLSRNYLAALDEQGFAQLPITARHALHAGALVGRHGDPFDRLLVAQSHLEGLALVTDDAAIREFDVETLW